MFRISFLMIFVLLLTSCTTSRVQDLNRASKLNAELGLAYLLKGRYDLALKKLRKSIKQNSDNAKAYLYTAELYRRLEQRESANSFYLQALDVAHDDASVNNNYGAFLCTDKKYKEAFKHFNMALKNPVYPERSKVFENIGVCSQNQGNIKIARENFVKAFKLNRRLTTSLLALAQIDFDAQRLTSAAKYLGFYNRVGRDTPQSLWLGILIAKKQHDIKRQRSLAWLLLKRFPKSKEAKILKKMKTRGHFND